jgi:hypothetical protein
VSVTPLDSTAVNALLRRADTGDRKAIDALRAQCAIEPARWRNFGDLAQQVRGHLVDTIARQNAFVAEAVAKEVGQLRRSWAGDAATPLERALAERIAAAWLYLHYAEMTYLALLTEGVTWERDEFHRKRIEQAERRYLRAIKALAQVRRLALPAVQVNVGGQQINVAG